MNREEKEKLASGILELYLKFGFGAVTKKEIDLLVFHHITRSFANKKKTNYEISSLLKIPESRVKNYRISSALKYESINSKAILGNIILRLTKDIQFMKVESGKVEISLEDPVEKREIENFLKIRGDFADYTFNSEVLRIAPARLFELIIENLDNGEKEFDRLIRNFFKDLDRSNKIIKNHKSLKEKFFKLRDEILTPSTFLELAGFALELYK